MCCRDMKQLGRVCYKSDLGDPRIEPHGPNPKQLWEGPGPRQQGLDRDRWRKQIRNEASHRREWLKARQSGRPNPRSKVSQVEEGCVSPAL